MKTGTTPLYPNDEVATSVTNYASKQSLALPEHVTKYHAWLFDARPDANLAISVFQSQALAWLAKTVGAKRGEEPFWTFFLLLFITPLLSLRYKEDMMGSELLG
ncbi:MAG: hypothetical protein OK454_06665 [Thaumarchaeota archaeon]|nr:hypothetical protein [Nitrososphaerota archaeon]